jgi:hypothetical protein
LLPEDRRKDGECDYHYLERLKEIARIAGLTITFLNKRNGKHRRTKGYDVRMNGEIVGHFRTKNPQLADCEEK